MVFSSALFLFLFLPVVVGGYFLLEYRLRNIWLLIASLVFYSWGEPKYILLMFTSIGVNYLIALWIDRTHTHTRTRIVLLWADIAVNLCLLGYFKYYGFLAENVNRLLGHFSDSGLLLPIKNIALPIGISFYIFQSMSYVIDVYRGKVSVQKDITKLGLYISFFPQLIAGPIVRYADVEKEISSRSVSLDDFYYGCRRFMIGFSKKILLADQLSPLVESIFSEGNGYSAICAWIGAIAYTLQIFFDFSGYSDMAIGIGRMFGFHFMENFDYPYISKSIKEFWRRWHISLSTWFRDYVYIPLGGSRCSTVRTYINLSVVFFLTGLWHGASWNFVAWGMYYAVILIVERLFLGRYLAKWPSIIGHIYSIILIIIGWVLFRADGLRNGLTYLRNMFRFEAGMWDQVVILMTNQYWFCLIAGIIFSLPVIPKLKRLFKNTHFYVLADVGAEVGIVVMFIIAIAYLLGKGFSPFLYFRF